MNFDTSNCSVMIQIIIVCIFFWAYWIISPIIQMIRFSRMHKRGEIVFTKPPARFWIWCFTSVLSYLVAYPLATHIPGIKHIPILFYVSPLFVTFPLAFLHHKFRQFPSSEWRLCLVPLAPGIAFQVIARELKIDLPTGQSGAE